MCGTVGMFVGCSALTYCPRALLTGGRPEPDPSGAHYRSPFQSWYSRASVRAAPRRIIADADAALLYFSPDLVPMTQHPHVKGLEDRAFGEILIQHLYRYLDFTAKLEYLVVNRTVLGIAHGSIGIPLPEEMRFDALKMYCDEAYHALFSVDLKRQVEQRTGVLARVPEEPFFLRRLQHILAELPAEERHIAELLFVIVSETLISASLAEIPGSDEVVPAVSETIRDHASDEGRHHAFFAIFLEHLWGNLTPSERRRAGVLTPRLMDTFLRPDLDELVDGLVPFGLGLDQARQVVEETYTPEILASHGRKTSRATRRYFDNLGAFDTAAAQDELAEYGFTE